jgi:uncharacterized protein YbaR (Trm112 family)
MFAADFLAMLRCPENRSSLAEADAALVQRLNAAVAAGALRNKGGEIVARSLEGGLVRADGAIVYPVFDGIPVLLIDEGIPADQLSAATAPSPAATTQT